MQYNSYNNLIYCLNQIKTINSIKHNIKRVREEKTNTRIFTWFGYPRLRPRLQAHPAWGFHYPSLPRLQMFTIDFQGVNGPLQQEIISPISSPQVFLTLVHSQFDEKWKLQQKLSLRVDLQMIAQWRFNLWRFSNLKLNISCVHLFMLAWVTKNELVLSLYSLNSKTSRY